MHRRIRNRCSRCQNVCFGGDGVHNDHVWYLVRTSCVGAVPLQNHLFSSIFCVDGLVNRMRWPSQGPPKHWKNKQAFRTNMCRPRQCIRWCENNFLFEMEIASKPFVLQRFRCKMFGFDRGRTWKWTVLKSPNSSGKLKIMYQTNHIEHRVDDTMSYNGMLYSDDPTSRLTQEWSHGR